ncbi:hypothetical protein [Mesorhizobium sp. M0460]|uniref:non-homologous end-joining DNA ligase LigD n=1 Tax=Mesorhizobium sp. M0460 TaxID=2956946 RepID=UPI00333D7F35
MGKGIHLMPRWRRRSRRTAAAFWPSRSPISSLKRRHLLSAAPSARTGRIFIDYLPNGLGNAPVGAFSPRVRPGCPIAHPMTWSQVEGAIRPGVFTIDRPFRTAVRKAG